MTDEIWPALSDEEWLQYGEDLGIMADFAAGKRPFGPDRRHTEEEKRHAVAAIALYNQPFGFGREDVLLLEEYATFLEHRSFRRDAELAQRARRLMHKIRALLPPAQVEKLKEKLAE